MTAPTPPLKLPHVGELVHFHTSNPNHHRAGFGSGPYAALVTRRLGGSQVELRVFAPDARDYVVWPCHVDDVAAPQRREGEHWSAIPASADTINLAPADDGPAPS